MKADSQRSVSSVAPPECPRGSHLQHLEAFVPTRTSTVRPEAKASIAALTPKKSCLSCPHHDVHSAHVAHVVSQQGAHLLLPPVSRRMQRRPPVRVPAVHIHSALQKYPDRGKGRGGGRGGEDKLRIKAVSLGTIPK